MTGKTPSKKLKKSLKNVPAKQLNIVVVADIWFPHVGGGQIHVKNLKSKLKECFGHNISVYAPRHNNLLYRIIWSLISPIHISFNCRHKKFDLIHSHGYLSGVTGKILSILLKLPVVHTVHGSNSLDLNQTSIKARIESIILTKINYSTIITVSNDFKKYQTSTKKVVYIPNGINIAKFDQIKDRKSKRIKILWIGRSDRVKGLDLFNSAMDIVKNSIKILNIEAIVDGRLSQTEIIKKYKSSHVFVLSSRSEGQPLTILEAWAAKTPVVATNVGGVASLVKNQINGMLVEPENPNSLAKAIIKILSSKTLADNLVKNGYNKVTSEHQWSDIANKTNSVYHQIIKENNANK